VAKRRACRKPRFTPARCSAGKTAAMSTPTTLVWFKRDLRVPDHAPLLAAAARGSVLPLYVIEPCYWQLEDVAPRHWQVLRAALIELRAALAALGQALDVREGEVCAVLDALHRAQAFDAMHAHEETGNAWTFARDRSVAAWCRKRDVVFREWRQFGVVRGLRRRVRWASQWEQLMQTPPTAAPLTGRVVLRAGTQPALMRAAPECWQRPRRQTPTRRAWADRASRTLGTPPLPLGARQAGCARWLRLSTPVPSAQVPEGRRASVDARRHRNLQRPEPCPTQRKRKACRYSTLPSPLTKRSS
jgi:hypothetical protein